MTANAHPENAIAPEDEMRIRRVVEAVCAELGVTARENARRNAITQRVESAFRKGRRLPLYLVAAGLSEGRAHCP